MKSSPSSSLAAALVATSLVVAASSSKTKTTPRSLTGSSWLGIDGNWSATSFRAADQDVSLFVSTTLSEHWLISTDGCPSNERLCTTNRGGTVDVSQSSDWRSLGEWSIGLSYLNVTANAQYGTDAFSLVDGLSNTALQMKDALVGAINTTSFYVGLFGLGIANGRFGTKTVTSPLAEMVEDNAWFPSYSYGYTAGAYYKNTPSSLTLGGYDARRLPASPNNVDFTLSRDTMIPRVLVRGIEVNTATDPKPANWDAAPQILTNYSNSFLAIVDSSTPYLWLPGLLVDEFVSAMNLTYNATLDAYVLTNTQLAALKQDDAFEFTLSLSSYDNTNNYGQPLAVDGVVNITLSGAAFAHVLQYPYNNQAIAYGQPAVPYFPIKKATGTNFVLGRVFLQEAYMLTRYDYSSFQLHQAAFPDNPATNRSIQTITQPLNSIYPSPGSMASAATSTLSKGALAGIIVGSIIGAALLGLALWWYLRRRHRRRRHLLAAEQQRDASTDGNFSYKLEDAAAAAAAAAAAEPATPRTPMARILSKILPHKKTTASPHRGLPPVAEVAADPVVVEIGAEQGHQVFELPDNQAGAAVEMDAYAQTAGGAAAAAAAAAAAGHPAGYVAQTLAAGEYVAIGLTPYQLAQHEMDMQLRGPVPPYSPGAHQPMLSSEKAALIPGGGAPPSPSPMTPYSSHWDLQSNAAVSAMTDASIGSHMALAPTKNPVGSLDPALGPAVAAPPPGAGNLQHALIDSTNIVCMGALPADVAVPGRDFIPRQPSPLVSPETTARLTVQQTQTQQRHMSTGTLGSNFTDTEEDVSALSEEPADGAARHDVSAQDDGLHSVRSASAPRIDEGEDLVHVPQVAEQRYSWEMAR